MMKKPEELTNEELRAACGIPEGCPPDVERAFLRAKIARYTRAGTAAVQAAAREQATWTAEQREAARLKSARRLSGKPTV
jgi:hypothetical protein